MKKQCNITSKT